MICHACHEATHRCLCVTLPSHAAQATRPAAGSPSKAPTKPLAELIATWDAEASISERVRRSDGYGALCRETAAALRTLADLSPRAA